MMECPPALAGVLWATRGRAWGFRFLLHGGFVDPLSTYERAFASLGDERSGKVGGPPRVAVRFPDPDGRRDRSGRLIPHDFIVVGALAEEIESVEDAVELLWPMVADAYARVWQNDHPPSAEDLDFGAAGDTGAEE